MLGFLVDLPESQINRVTVVLNKYQRGRVVHSEQEEHICVLSGYEFPSIIFSMFFWKGLWCIQLMGGYRDFRGIGSSEVCVGI